MLWHSSSIEETLKELGAFMDQGLSAKEVKNRQQTYGMNILTAKKGKNLFIKFLEQLADFMIIILILAAIVPFSILSEGRTGFC